MKKKKKLCDCYKEYKILKGWEDADTPIYSHILQSRCSGTMELEMCFCGGDRTKCDFYPEVREKALKKKLKEKKTKWIGKEGSDILICEHCGWEHNFPIPKNYCPKCGYKAK